MDRDQELQRYWKKNMTYIASLLAIWFIVSYLFGIVLVDQLDAFHVAGFPVGFWFANQGSQIVFCILIIIYVRLLNRLDHQFNVYED